jgi:hypothetical protein
MSKNNVIELFIAKSLGKDFHRQNILFNLKKYNILIINFPAIYNSLVSFIIEQTLIYHRLTFVIFVVRFNIERRTSILCYF